MGIKHYLGVALVSYAVVVATGRISMLRSLAGF